MADGGETNTDTDNYNSSDNKDEIVTTGPAEWPTTTSYMVALSEQQQSEEQAGETDKAEKTSLEQKTVQQLLDFAMKTWTKIYDTGGLLDQVRDLVPAPATPGQHVDPADAMHKYLEDNIKNHGWTTQDLARLYHEIYLRNRDLPSRAILLQVIREEWVSTNTPAPHPGDDDDQDNLTRSTEVSSSHRMKEALPPTMARVAAAADQQYMTFYIQTRQYAKGLSWTDLWSRFNQHASQYETSDPGLVELLQFKAYSNEILARYFHADHPASA